LQELVVASQSRRYERYADIGVPIQAIASDNPAVSPQDLESSRTRVLGYIITIGMHRELALQRISGYQLANKIPRNAYFISPRYVF
jgi:hypothetical protein